ncbi:MAG TPA: MFS transporter [Microbacterium sp.]|nr:MFS transporter [Microbacterium sp.]
MTTALAEVRAPGRRTQHISLVVAGFGQNLVLTTMYFAGFANILVLLVFIFLTGLTLGIFLVVQATMIADAVDDVQRRTGMRNDGISFSSLTFVSKIMNALAVLVFGVFIVIAGYEAGVTVTPELQWTVYASLALVPAVSCLVSAVPFLFYRLRS